jgi:predicted transcriptional regulator of viral defense system
MHYIGEHGIVRPRDIGALGLPREYLIRLHRLSALVFHEITTQNPASVWIALSKGARTPVLASPSLRIVRLSGPSLTEGIDKHQVEGVTVRVYSTAKTVAECFKFRNKIGLDVANEALKDCLRQKKASINEIYRYAKVCRVSNIIRPYMEALC